MPCAKHAYYIYDKHYANFVLCFYILTEVFYMFLFI